MGKSTSILYLLGEEMQKIGLNHIDAKRPLTNNDLEEVISSSNVVSETSTLNAIPFSIGKGSKEE